MRYRRVYIPGGSYFFTLTLQDRNSRLLTQNVDILRRAFIRVQKHHPFQLDAIVVLPEHLHMIMSLPNDDKNFSMRINLIKGTFSRQMIHHEQISSSRKHKRERGIWQRRFWEHLIRDEKDYETHINYIHYNPVKHGYTTNPTQWAFSSIHRYIENKIIPKDWAYQPEENQTLNYGEQT